MISIIMKIRLSILCTVAAVMIAVPLGFFIDTGETQGSSPEMISGKFYKYDIVAEAVQGGSYPRLSPPSINDHGTVAFHALNSIDYYDHDCPSTG